MDEPSADALAERHEHILRAAADLLYEVGAAHPDLHDVAAAAGLSRSQVDELVGSRAALIVGATGREVQDFLADLLVSITEGAPAAAALVDLIVELQSGDLVPMHPLLAETLVVGIRDDAVRAELRPHLRYALAALDVVIREAQDEHLIASDVHVRATSHLCLTLLIGSCVVAALGLERPAPELARSVIMSVVQGLAQGSASVIDLRARRRPAARGQLRLRLDEDDPAPRP